MANRLVVLALLSCLSLALATLSPLRPSRDEVMGWTRGERATGESPISFTIYLKQQNKAVLEAMVYDVSNPLSENYGRYLTQKELAAVVGASDDQIRQVLAWVNQYEHISVELVDHKDAIRIDSTVGSAEALLGVELSHYYNDFIGGQVIRSPRDYKVPAHVAKMIDLINGITNFPPPQQPNLPQEQQQQRQQATAATNAPIAPIHPANITIAEFINSTFAAEFLVYCKGGNLTLAIDPTQLCADFPPLVNDFTVVVAPINPANGHVGFTQTVVPSTCTIDFVIFEFNLTDGTIDFALVTRCTIRLTVTPIPLIPLKLSLLTNYADGSHSTAVYAFPVVDVPLSGPADVKRLYNIPANSRVTHPGASQSVAEFEGQFFSPADLEAFFAKFNIPPQPVTIIGPNDPTIPGEEANLDLQYIMGVGVDAPTTFWSLNGSFSVDILEWATQVNDATNPPAVHSVSYGLDPVAIVVLNPTPGYQARAEIEFQKLALRGITLIAASGDAGAANFGRQALALVQECTTSDPLWPAKSPFFTAVSATFFTEFSSPACYEPPSQGGIPCNHFPLREVAASVETGVIFTTGGGFSDFSARPHYQADFVEQYLRTITRDGTIPPAGFFNRSGRAYPDVSMLGVNLEIFNNGTLSAASGTSASAPIFAGVISLLNDIRLKAGLPTLGFLNPLLYQIARDFPIAYNDVTFGNNRCGTSANMLSQSNPCCPDGFEAVQGYDAATGLGSPNYEVFRDLVLFYGSRSSSPVPPSSALSSGRVPSHLSLKN